MTCIKVYNAETRNFHAGNANRNEGRTKMIISLRRIRNTTARVPWLARGLTAWMALSLVFVLTPCCEIFGEAYAAAAPTADNDSHPHEPDGHGGVCGKWLDNASPSGMVSYGALTPSWEGKAVVLLAPEHGSFLSHNPGAITWRLFHSQSPPPHALYLRFARLLI